VETVHVARPRPQPTRDGFENGVLRVASPEGENPGSDGLEW